MCMGTGIFTVFWNQNLCWSANLSFKVPRETAGYSQCSSSQNALLLLFSLIASRYPQHYRCNINTMQLKRYMEYLILVASGIRTVRLRLLCVLVLMHGKSVSTRSPSICFVEAKHIDEWRQVFTLDALPSSLAQYLTTGLVHQLAITAWEEPDWSRLLLLGWARGMLGHVSASSCVCVCVLLCNGQLLKN